MTGLDALRARGRYKTDMERLRLALLIAQDEGEGEHAQRIQQAMSAREVMRRLETAELARLLGLIEPELGSILYFRRVRGLTIRQTAGETRRSVESVRAAQRRAEAQLERLASLLPGNTEYAEANKIFQKKGV